jgi:penicillin G amidase
MEHTPITENDLKAALPDTTSPLTLTGLDGVLEIIRDNLGIPHLKAQTTHDAFFGQGFATAQDRLWHMDYDRHRAHGRWAEFAGSEAVEGDTLMRRLRLADSVKADYEVTSEAGRAMLDAYASGVNAFIESTKSLPIEYKILGVEPELWDPLDCLSVYKVRHVLTGTFQEKLWRGLLVAQLGPKKTAELLPDYPEGALMIAPPGAEYLGPALSAFEELKRGAEAVNYLREFEGGSNSWALSGERTATGKPLVCGDAHRALDTPNAYYQIHVACPEFDAMGHSFPGVPGFNHYGHNGHTMWCVTTACADYQDLYVERFKPDDPTQYEFKDKWEKADIYHETIEVRGGEPVQIEVAVTHHGTVIAGDPSDGYALALRHTGTAAGYNWPDALLKQLLAESADDQEEAMRTWIDPCNNYVFADVQGNIGYLTRGQIPIRSKANRWIPVPGWTGEHGWDGFIPFEALPRIRNPETGVIVTANNRIVENDEPYYIGIDYAPEFRARSIYKRVSRLKGATVEQMPSIHAERRSIPAQAYACLLRDVEPLDELSVIAKELLVKWDGCMDRELVEPTLYSAFRDSLVKMVLDPILGPLAERALEAKDSGGARHVTHIKEVLPRMIETGNRSLLPDGADWQSLMGKALSAGIAYLQEHLGETPFAENWKWGAVHVTRPRHTLTAAFPHLGKLLDPPSIGTHGDSDTPLQGGYSLEPYIVTTLSVTRYLFDLSDLRNSRWSVPLGSSGHPGSPHYADQAGTWAEVELTPMLYDWDDIQEGAESLQRLSPGE